MLTRRGYKVITAVTPADALRSAKEYSGHIDLVLSDVVMPQMSGPDLIKRLLSIHPKAEALFMSGYTADVIAQRGVFAEGVAFIQKPFSAQELVARVREVLERRS